MSQFLKRHQNGTNFVRDKQVLYTQTDLTSQAMQLYSKKYGQHGPNLIILHGLFGMSDNWHNIAGKLSESFTVYTIDLRNHGQSPHSSEMNYPIMAADISEFMEQHQIQKTSVIGHSMGGKAAMMFANAYPDKIEQLVVVDISPGAYPPGHDKYFAAMRNINFNAPSRKEIEMQLAQTITNQGEMLFLLKNLYRTETGNYALKLNLDALENHYSEIRGAVPLQGNVNCDTLFISGEHSKYIQDLDIVKIKTIFTNTTFTTISGAGHWVHADQPLQFIETVKNFIRTP